jgi:hypothetical protein
MGEIYYCAYCKINTIGRDTWLFGSKRCKSCANSKEHNPGWVGGWDILEHFCIACQVNKICYDNWKYGSNLCRLCENRSRNYKGSNNPGWKGGLSEEGYSFEFTQQLKDLIRKRDDYKCRNCGKLQEQEISDRTKQLAVHHIDYNKGNCHQDNLITLCVLCHMKSNHNRDYWYAYYTYIMENIKCLTL